MWIGRILVSELSREDGQRLRATLWHEENDVTELIQFGHMMGLRSSLLREAEFPHFKLYPSKRDVALRLGARPASLNDWKASRRALPGLDVDVNDLGAKWVKADAGWACCAVCGATCEREERDKASTEPTPLVMWRWPGEMVLVLCWACVQRRLKKSSKQ
jgi:hypothetical protein